MRRANALTNFSGEKIGVLEVASNVTSVIQQAQFAMWSTVIGTVVVSVLSLLGFMLFARALGGVLVCLTGTMSTLASGDLNATIEGKDLPDEIGAMARAVQVFNDNALKTKELERQADEQRNTSEEQRRRSSEEQRQSAQAMAQATNGLATGLKHLSSGDLTFQLEQPFATDFEGLRADFNATVEQLRGTLG